MIRRRLRLAPVFAFICVAPLLSADRILPAGANRPESHALRIQLEPVITAGLSQPVLLTNAGDGTRRSFIVDQPGRILVLEEGSTTLSLFLDLSARVLFGGEQGLLGLAFHPSFSENRRLFVNYTRRPDGATVISEFRSDAGDPNRADPDETVVMVIPQPFSNHNGGMIEFGEDGFLYVGTGDGGSGNDPGNRAQDPLELLGKILRIDVDRSEAGRPYASPPDNPFFGNPLGRDEIFALGLRNPWRFSFDRLTGRLWAADVGQNQVEEVDTVRIGGNYGWRILEGTRCTGLGPQPCLPENYLPPVVEYLHDQGRCSVTGGYVYRGSKGSLPYGAYVFGDFCSGEIFLWLNGSMTILADTGENIASFGEDEEGEVYAVSLQGGVYRIANPDAQPAPAFYFPRLVTDAGMPPGQDEYTGIAVSGHDAGAANLTFTAFDLSGLPFEGPDVENPASVPLQPGGQVAALAGQIFGPGFDHLPRTGWMRLEAGTRNLAPLFLSFNSTLTMMDGGVASSLAPALSILPEVEPRGFNRIHVANPSREPVGARLELIDSYGRLRSTAERLIAGLGALSAEATELFGGASLENGDYIRISGLPALAAYSHIGIAGRHVRGISGQDGTAGADHLYCPQYVTGQNYRSIISLVNLESTPGEATLRLFDDSGNPVGRVITVRLAPWGKAVIAEPDAFVDPPDDGDIQGYVEAVGNGVKLAGSVSFIDGRTDAFAAALPLASLLQPALFFGHLASGNGYFTGLAILNPADNTARVSVEAFGSSGEPLASQEIFLPARGRRSNLLTQYFPSLNGVDIRSGYIRVKADSVIAGFALFGRTDLAALAAIPGAPPAP